MGLQSSGQISLNDVAGEFGGSVPHAISEYRGKGNCPSSGEIQVGADLGVKECILGMAHRGRLKVLVNVFQKTYENVFSEFQETAYNDEKWSS